MPTSCRSGFCSSRCQVFIFGLTGFFIVAERTAIFYCFGYYLWFTRIWWALLTLALMLPGAAVQVLSFKWYHADEDHQRTCLGGIHVLQLGIFKRLWDCIQSVCDMEGSSGELGAIVMQQADVSALRLLEGLLLTLPQTLLHSYILFNSDVGVLSPVPVSCAVCLLSHSWALVLYSRACSLIRPGHLDMPPAALLCQLLWRASMLGARIASLMFFTRVFGWWVYGIIGFHWLVASFWLVCQQTDICRSPWRWRLFNCILGVIHVFFYLNVKDSPSRFRMAGFYLVMLLENTILLLSASDFLSEATWESMGIPISVFCSFFLGIISLVLYYRFLHPKSMEISQNLQQAQLGIPSMKGGESLLSLGDKNMPVHSTDAQQCNISPTGVAEYLGEYSEIYDTDPCGQCKHHHWMLICLALKTGNPTKIHLAFGARGERAMSDVVEIPEINVESPPPEPECKDGPSPLSDGRKDSQSASDHSPSTTNELNGEEDKLEPESQLESCVSKIRRGTPEGKSVFEDSLEPNFCPTESTNTLYFTADPQSPSSVSNLGLDRDTIAENHGDPGRITGDRGLHKEIKVLLNTGEPVYTPSCKISTGPQGAVSPCFGSPRRQMVQSWKDKIERC